jgi:histidine triad (HIT) family protein
VAQDCIFCAIVAGEQPAHLVDEDEHTIAFLDILPWTRGHALVVPRRHSRNLYEIDDDDLRAAGLAAKRLAGRMRERLECDGINLLNSSEPAANQEVFHFHIHVLPRWDGDGLRLPPRPEPPGADEFERVAASLRGW